MRRLCNFLLALFLTVNLAAACSSQQTVTTRTVQYDPQTGEPVTVEKETTTTTDGGGSGSGVVSGTFSVLGQVIMLPLRVLGVLLHVIL